MNDAHVHACAHATPTLVQAVRARGGRPQVLDAGCWNGTPGEPHAREANAVVDGIEGGPMQEGHARGHGYGQVDVADLDPGAPGFAARSCDFLLSSDVQPPRWLGRAWPALFAIQIVLEAVPRHATPRD